MTNHQLLKYFLLFVISFSLFSYFQYSPTFPDPDSFYHAKMALLIREQGIVKDFPWLQFTVLKDYYIDHHFLYHVLLVPFVSYIEPLAGVKLATALFAALLILVFCWFLEKQKISPPTFPPDTQQHWKNIPSPHPRSFDKSELGVREGGGIKGAFFYSLLLLVTSPFIFRINLAKASAVAIAILIFGLYFIFTRKHWPLFILSFIYVWTHGGWPLILVLTALYVFSDAIVNLSHQKRQNDSIGYQVSNIKYLTQKVKRYTLYFILYTLYFFRLVFTKPNIKLLAACLGGLMAGIIINPFFPQNLHFYWYHIVKIAVINYKDKIGVGAEWYPYNLGDIVADSSFIFILLILVFFIFFIKFIKYFIGEKEKWTTTNNENTQLLSLMFLVVFFLLLTLGSRRNVEYFAPFAMLFAAFSLNQPLSFLKTYWLSFKKWRQKRKILASALCLYFLVLLPFIAGRNIWSVKKPFNSGYPAQKYKGASEWLKNNTPADSIVFHNDWDDFPPLFYYNTHNRYIAGLDPTFMYNYNSGLYQKWVNITAAREKNISQIVKNDFGANFVFVDKDHPALDNNLKTDSNFVLVYKDEEGKIYKLKNY